MLKRKLLILEINEIPWRVIDKFKFDPRFPHIRPFFDNSKTYTTIAESGDCSNTDTKLVYGLSKEGKKIVVDSDELSPWVTWPTFHCGLKNKEHGIKFLGQDITTFKGKPIWEEFLKRGYSVGVCGSLQSWPPLDPGKDGFYIPDTFAHDESCIPQFIEPFQKFNLDQVQKNGLVIREEILSKNLLPFLISLPKLGISLDTITEIIKHLLSEMIDRKYAIRRTTFQSILLWDIFKSLYNVNDPPAFSTFFTNHFASVMHRYWNYIFPDDFKESYKNSNSINYENMRFALQFVDKILKDSINFCEINPDITLVFATSMGQDAIIYDSYEGYSAEIEDIAKLLSILNINSEQYKPLLAMVPQVALEVSNESVKTKIKQGLSKCFSLTSKQVFSVEDAGKSVSITVYKPTAKDVNHGGFIYKNGNNEDIKITWDRAGLIMHELDVATAYHVPEGIMAIYGKNVMPSDSREVIQLKDCKQTLLNLI